MGLSTLAWSLQINHCAKSVAVLNEQGHKSHCTYQEIGKHASFCKRDYRFCGKLMIKENIQHRWRYAREIPPYVLTYSAFTFFFIFKRVRQGFKLIWFVGVALTNLRILIRIPVSPKSFTTWHIRSVNSISGCWDSPCSSPFPDFAIRPRSHAQGFEFPTISKELRNRRTWRRLHGTQNQNGGALCCGA